MRTCTSECGCETCAARASWTVCIESCCGQSLEVSHRQDEEKGRDTDLDVDVKRLPVFGRERVGLAWPAHG